MFVHSAALGSFVCLFAFTGNIFVFFQLLCSSGPLLICFQHISAGLNERNGISVDIWYMNSINFGNKVLVSVWLFGCLRFYSVQLILEERGVSQCLRKYAGLVLCVARCVALQLINVKHVEQRFYKQIRSTSEFRLRYQLNSIANSFFAGFFSVPLDYK